MKFKMSVSMHTPVVSDGPADGASLWVTHDPNNAQHPLAILADTGAEDDDIVFSSLAINLTLEQARDLCIYLTKEIKKCAA